MVPRIRFTIRLVCQLCWVLADAQVSMASDAEAPAPDFRVDHCPSTFRVTLETGSRATTRIVCAACGDIVHGH